MLQLNLRQVLKNRGIDKPYAFLVKIGFTPHSANVILNNKVKVLNLKYLELLCLHLNCEPSDLMQWTPDKNSLVPETHTLYNLIKPTGDEINLITNIYKVPYKQLKELAKQVEIHAKQTEG